MYGGCCCCVGRVGHIAICCVVPFNVELRFISLCHIYKHLFLVSCVCPSSWLLLRLGFPIGLFDLMIRNNSVESIHSCHCIWVSVESDARSNMVVGAFFPIFFTTFPSIYCACVCVCAGLFILALRITDFRHYIEYPIQMLTASLRTLYIRMYCECLHIRVMVVMGNKRNERQRQPYKTR